MRLDDDRLANASRLLRRRQALRQADLTTSRFVAHEIEAGRAGRLRIDHVRGHFAGLDATLRVSAWWNGAALDRLIDERHAAVVERTARTLAAYGFRVATEVSFNEYGDRGSIDVFAGHVPMRAAFVGEAKSEWGSLEETIRRLDVKIRIAPKLALTTFGWRAAFVAGVLIFPEDRTARRIADRYAATLGASFPARGREVRRWLRQPSGDVRGIWFLTDAETDRHVRKRSG